MTPALRHSDADRKLLLLAIWKLLRRVTRRISKSMQMTADPRTQAVKSSQSGLMGGMAHFPTYRRLRRRSSPSPEGHWQPWRG